MNRKNVKSNNFYFGKKSQDHQTKQKNTAGEAAKDEGNILYAWEEIQIHI